VEKNKEEQKEDIILFQSIRNSKKDWKMLKADLGFHTGLESLIRKGIFRNKTEATANLVPLLDSNLWGKRIITKSRKVKIFKNQSKRKKIELEFGV
jgi:hypothetical protein